MSLTFPRPVPRWPQDSYYEWILILAVEAENSIIILDNLYSAGRQRRRRLGCSWCWVHQSAVFTLVKITTL